MDSPENEILRSAQNDIGEDFFSILPGELGENQSLPGITAQARLG